MKSNLPERLDSIKNTLYFISNYANENNIENIIITGDIFHNKGLIYSIALNIFLDFLRDNKNINFIIIDGNHDLSGKSEDVVSALSCLKNEPNVNYISEPIKIENIFFVPYSSKMIEIIKNNSSDYLISHFGLNEGMLNSGISTIADIGLNDLIGKYKIVICGHYHAPQEIINDSISFQYCGSIIQLDYGEKNDIKRFLIIDNETNEIKSIPTEGYKKYYHLEINNENKDNIYIKAKKLKDEGHHVKIIQNENINILQKIKDEFQIIDKTVKDISNRGISSTMSVEDKLRKYLEIKEISKDVINKYLEVGFEIINNCIGEN